MVFGQKSFFQLNSWLHFYSGIISLRYSYFTWSHFFLYPLYLLVSLSFLNLRFPSLIKWYTLRSTNNQRSDYFMEYKYVSIDVDFSGKLKEDYKDVISENSLAGYRFVSAIPLSFNALGPTKYDFVFEKERD